MQFYQLPLSQNVVQPTTTVSAIQSIFAMATQTPPATITLVSCDKIQDTICVKNFEGRKFCKFHNKYQSHESIIMKALRSFVYTYVVMTVQKYFSGFRVIKQGKLLFSSFREIFIQYLENFPAYSTSSSPLPVQPMPLSTHHPLTMQAQLSLFLTKRCISY